MNGVKLIWSLLSFTPDEWLIQNRINVDFGEDDMRSYVYRDSFEWEMTDDIDAIIEHRLGHDMLIRYQYMCGLDNLKEFKSHVKQLKLILFVIRKRTFQVLETVLGSSTVREVYSIPLSKLPERYVYIGIVNSRYGSTYLIGKHESTVLRNVPITVLKLPLYHKGGPTYAFDSRWARTDYDRKPNFDQTYKKDHWFYYDIESTFPRNPCGYYDKCMELIAGEIRTYDQNGNLIKSAWEYSDVFHKGYEDFTDPKTFQEMMSLEWPIFWYRD